MTFCSSSTATPGCAPLLMASFSASRWRVAGAAGLRYSASSSTEMDEV